VLEEHLDDAEEHAKVIDATGVGGWIVRHEEEQENENQRLHTEREPIDAPP
jgi:hypothetical protein